MGLVQHRVVTAAEAGDRAIAAIVYASGKGISNLRLKAFRKPTIKAQLQRIVAGGIARRGQNQEAEGRVRPREGLQTLPVGQAVVPRGAISRE